MNLMVTPPTGVNGKITGNVNGNVLGTTFGLYGVTFAPNFNLLLIDSNGKSTKDTIVVDKSRNSQSQMNSLIAKGSIPPPIANRGFLDSFNFFNPPGRMKD